MPMQPEEMGEMQSKMGKDNSGGVTKMAQDLAEKLSQFKDMIDNSESTTDKDKQDMSMLMEKFVSLVEKQLGSNPGEDYEEDEGPGMGGMPMMAGAHGIPMGPQTKQ